MKHDQVLPIVRVTEREKKNEQLKPMQYWFIDFFPGVVKIMTQFLS